MTYNIYQSKSRSIKDNYLKITFENNLTTTRSHPTLYYKYVDSVHYKHFAKFYSSSTDSLYCDIAYFEQNLHTQISGVDLHSEHYFLWGSQSGQYLFVP